MFFTKATKKKLYSGTCKHVYLLWLLFRLQVPSGNSRCMPPVAGRSLRVFWPDSSRHSKSVHGLVFLNTYVDYNSSAMAVTYTIHRKNLSIYGCVHFDSLGTPYSHDLINCIYSDTMPLTQNRWTSRRW